MPPTTRTETDKKNVIQVSLLFTFFFLIIAAFWSLKPLRTTSVVKAFGPEYYPLFKQGLIFFVPFLMAFFSSMTCYLSREGMVYFFSALFVTASWIFWGLFHFYPVAWVKICFFFYVDAFITLMVVLFFSYMSDLFNPNEAKKYYGIIGMGGLLGGVVGSAVSGWAGPILGNNIIFAVTLFLLPVCFIVRYLRHVLPPAPTKYACSPDGKTKWQRFSEGIILVFRTRYLFAIVLIVGIYEVVSTNLDYQFNFASSQAFSDPTQMASYQAKVAFYANLASLFVQLILTTWILRSKGVMTALLVLPVTLLLGSAAFFLMPMLGIISLTVGSDNALSNSINQISKEILYVPLDSVARFKSKAFIDMFVLRGAKALAGAILLTYTLYLSKHGFTNRFLLGINLSITLVWIMAVVYVAKVFNEYVQAESPAEEAERLAS